MHLKAARSLIFCKSRTDSLKAGEEDRKTDHAPLVKVKENGEVAIVTATIETKLWQGDLETGAGLLSRDLPSSERDHE